MTVDLQSIIRRHSRQLAPRPTGAAPQLRELPTVRAVLFDIYGTLFISASGDVGSSSEDSDRAAFADALAAAGAVLSDVAACAASLRDTIEKRHQELRQGGVEHPEVDITEIWRRVIEDGVVAGRIAPEARRLDLQRLAVEYEVRANPVWPMPHLEDCLARLRDGGVAMGIISNAQFYTLEIFPALLNQDRCSLGFDPQLEFFSFQHGCAKPGRGLYERAADALRKKEIDAEETLFVGNDMLNDIRPASDVGFRTALFAGDQRSLRRREGDDRVSGLAPDVVLTDLLQLPPLIPLPGRDE